MKRIIGALLIILTVIAAVGCERQPEKKPTVSMFDLSRKMLEAHGGEEGMAYASNSDTDAEAELAYVAEIDYSNVEAFFVSYASDAKGNADEIAVIALKDPADAEAAADQLKAHVSKRMELYSVYDPEQVPALEKARVFTHAQYAVLIVSSNADAVEKAFSDFIG